MPTEQEKQLAKEIKRVYEQAAKETQKKLADFIKGHRARNQKMLQYVRDGVLSESDYQHWLKGQIFQEKQWKEKVKDVTQIYLEADKKAHDLVNGTAEDVFVDVANHTAYDIEKDFKGGVSFNIYDERTVERLLRDDPQVLPKWKINEPKDYIWNQKRVQNSVLQGIIQGESIAEIGQRLTTELATSNEKKMRLFARTAMTGAQNAGRMQRLRETESMGIEVRKKWLATLDSKTRDAHRDLDGQERKVNENFESDDGEIAYPGDPTAPAKLVYNCRCTLTYVYPQYQHLQQNHQRYDQENKEFIQYKTYRQWERWKKGEPEPETSQIVNASQQPQKTGIEQIKEIIQNHNGNWSTDELIELGSKVNNEINEYFKDDKARIAEIKKETKQIHDELEKIRKTDGISSEKYKELVHKVDGFYFEEIKLLNKINAFPIISKIRKCGGVTNDNIEKYANFNEYKNRKKEAKEKIIEALNCYPMEWLEKSSQFKTELKPHWTTGRAYYNHWGEIRISEEKSTNVHELGHRFEHVISNIFSAEKEFYEKRTEGEKLTWLGKPYGRNEKSRFDSFLDTYMGKEYKINGEYDAFELVSMGFQFAFTDDFLRLQQDKEMCNWILGILAGVK